MSFLKINDANPSSKRPFRLKDLQDIWEGICALFITVDEPFRIVSGFELDGDVFTSGTVWFNGQLYTYDDASIGRDTISVEFVRVAQADRLIEGGISQPFSYVYVCRAANEVSGDARFDSFVSNIEKYKTYVGNGTITTPKIADRAVTNDKLSFDIKRATLGETFITAVSGQSFALDDLYDAVAGSTKRISINASATWGITLSGFDLASGIPYEMPVMVVNPSPHSGTVTLILNDPSEVEGRSATYSVNMDAQSVRIFRFLTDTGGHCFLERL